MQKTYPAVVFISRHGRHVAAGAGLAAALVLQVPAVLTHNPVWSAAGVATAAVVWGLVRVAAEVVEVVADTLLPR